MWVRHAITHIITSFTVPPPPPHLGQAEVQGAVPREVRLAGLVVRLARAGRPRVAWRQRPVVRSPVQRQGPGVVQAQMHLRVRRGKCGSV